MTRQIIDFGIDPGTTNSAIAVRDGVEPGIVKNNPSQELSQLHPREVSEEAQRAWQAGII